MKKLKEKLSAKLSKNGGFTLIEMLIVVAIIAILIAVSIPLVGSALEGAREATDASNERSFKAALVSSYLLNTANMQDPSSSVKVEAGKVYAYDAAKGSVVATEPSTAYGQGHADGGGKDDDPKTGDVLFGKIDTTGSVSMWWDTKAAPTDTMTAKDNLTGPKLGTT